MKVESFQNMLAEYDLENGDIDSDDLEKRKMLLDKYKFSVIVEGEHNEFDNLDKWIKLNIDVSGLENIYYGKTGYDYGFAEYFTSDRTKQEKLKFIIPNIFTVYPDAFPSREISKSNGYGNFVQYDSSNNDAVVFDVE